jgi:hypothetical protein
MSVAFTGGAPAITATHGWPQRNRTYSTCVSSYAEIKNAVQLNNISPTGKAYQNDNIYEFVIIPFS